MGCLREALTGGNCVHSQSCSCYDAPSWYPIDGSIQRRFNEKLRKSENIRAVTKLRQEIFQMVDTGEGPDAATFAEKSIDFKEPEYVALYALFLRHPKVHKNDVDKVIHNIGLLHPSYLMEGINTAVELLGESGRSLESDTELGKIYEGLYELALIQPYHAM